MKKKNSKAERSKKMMERIDILFGNMSPKQIAQVEKHYQTSVMDMFRVTGVFTGYVELTHLFNDDIYCPVFIDKELCASLKPEDVFLMTLDLRDKGWHVLYMSPPYS